MEIQDRNSLLQILGVAKDGNTQFSSVEGNLFADILKSAKDEASFPQNDSKDMEFKQVVRHREVSANIKAGDFDKKETSPKKIEDSHKDTVVSKKEENKPESKKELKEENVSTVQAEGSVKKEEIAGDKKETVSEASDVVEDDSSEIESDTVDLQDDVVSVAVVAPVWTDAVLPDVVPVTEDVLVVDQNPQVLSGVNVQNVEEVLSKENVAAPTQYDAEEFVVLSEKDALIMEQAKYFDEKITSDKKLKIQVNVSEAKIADPMVKDVLKNRFEIDSMFQSVDETVDLSNLEVEDVAEDVSSVEKNTNVLPEAKNVVFNEMKTIQEVAKTPVAKDTTVMAVSGKEVVAEAANVSRNEAFVRINETTSRDTFKGMAKEVVEQIKVNITKSAVKGVDTIDIQLKPEDLGKVQIKMHIAKDGKLQAEIIASRAETADLLQKDASLLSKAFNDAGYNTDDKSFTFSFQNENQAKGQEKDDVGLLKFIGETLEQEAENIAGNDNLGYDPVLGLNIRV